MPFSTHASPVFSSYLQRTVLLSFFLKIGYNVTKFFKKGVCAIAEEINALARIIDLCQQRNYSYYELAKRSGIPYSTLNTILLKGSNPSLHTLQRLCEGLGISLQQFFHDGSSPTVLTSQQEECLSLFNVLNHEDQSLAIAFMKGLARKL